jgi:CheY-like chemotaxis protein
MDGYEVCRRLHNKPETARIPVMMLTAKGRLTGLEGLGAKRILHKHVEERVKGFNVGAIEFLSKPIVARAVVDAVERVFRVVD